MNATSHRARTVLRASVTAAMLVGLAALPSSSSAEQAGDAQQGTRAHFSLAGAGETYTRKGEVREIKLTAIQSDGRYTMVDGELKKGTGVPAHFHKWHAEVFYVTSGQVEWTVDGETHLMGPGSLVYIPPGAVHAVKVIGDQDEHHLLISQPGGHEYVIRRQQAQTPAEQADPAAREKLDELNDFYLAPIRK